MRDVGDGYGRRLAVIDDYSPTLYEFHEQDSRIRAVNVAPTLNTFDKGLVLCKRIRSLTPKECGRLQGFPDDWCDGVKGSDSAQYTMWGNSVAIPCVLYLMEGIAELEKKERKKE